VAAEEVIREAGGALRADAGKALELGREALERLGGPGHQVIVRRET
jgi:hypothetical protein